MNDAMEAVTNLVDTSGGFVVSVSRTEDEFESFAFMSFRIPSNDLEAILSRVRDISERVERENRSSQDVTTEFVDIEARLGNLRAAEQQLMVLFERSGKVSDVLEVQRELTNMRGQIESLQGRLNYLSQTTATSLVSVWFHPTTSTAPISDPAWSPSETARGRYARACGIWQVVRRCRNHRRHLLSGMGPDRCHSPGSRAVGPAQATQECRTSQSGCRISTRARG